MKRKKFFNFIFLLIFLGTSGCSSSTPAIDQAQEPVKIYDRARILYDKGHYEKAKEYFHEYLAQVSSSSDLYTITLFYLGNCYEKLGQNKKALFFYNKIITQHDEDPFWVESARKRVAAISK